MPEITKKFDYLFERLSSSSFLTKDGLGGEIPFFISCYKPEEQLRIEEDIKLLIKKLDTEGIPVLEINLYDWTCDILNQNIGIEKMLRIEKKKNKDRFLRALQSSLNIHEVLMPAIKEKIDNSNAKIYFLTGIGQVFPFIRSHTILNNLQSIAVNAPTLMFFPGAFNGFNLKLFSLLTDDNYYRASNIDTIQTK